MRPCRELVALLEAMLDSARAGDLREFFAVVRYDNGEFDAGYITSDLGDLLLQVRTEVIKAQIDAVHEQSEAQADGTKH
jgi:hypothetical protein